MPPPHPSLLPSFLTTERPTKDNATESVHNARAQLQYISGRSRVASSYGYDPAAALLADVEAIYAETDDLFRAISSSGRAAAAPAAAASTSATLSDDLYARVLDLLQRVDALSSRAEAAEAHVRDSIGSTPLAYLKSWLS